MPDIVELNQLVPAEDGVLVPSGTGGSAFAYTDGAEVEAHLREVLATARDTGSRSAELQAAIRDWPSEYHLSSDRSNLLRPYNLDAVDRVLELGSGCGAISRYLGELGKRVDAVEGSPSRAALGRLRCRDLDNVRVICANYNDLVIPEQGYDLVLFVGVIEYARRFLGGEGSDREAAEEILRRAGGYLEPGGAVFVAIENRLGLKYQIGAHEDHYAKRYVGINGYREAAGIATYSHGEWAEIVSAAGFGESTFAYPFPDYKVPRVILGDGYLEDNPHAANHLEGLVSRDYHAPLARSERETIGWQAAVAGGYLGAVANSFSILMGNDAGALRQMQDFDFCHAPGPGRKPAYAVCTVKPAGSGQVFKHPVDPSAQPADDGIRQLREPEDFIAGDLLSAQWLRTILIYVRRDEFERVIREYYDFLGSQEASAGLAIDLLPINILVTPEGEWRVFDQEWVVDWEISREYLLFRALVTFIVGNWPYLRDFLAWLELRNVRDFIEWGFHANRIHLSEHLEDFIALENRFQQAIAPSGADNDARALLDTVFDFSDGAETLFSAVYWREEAGDWSEARCAVAERNAGPGVAPTRFPLGGAGTIRHLRFDPFDLRRQADTGFFHVESLALVAAGENGERILWQLAGADAVADAAGATSALPLASGEGVTWVASTDFPKLVFDTGADRVAAPGETLHLEVCWGVVRSREYALAYNHCLAGNVEKDRLVERALLNLESMKIERNRLRNMETELTHIKASRAFRIGTRIVRAASLLKPGSQGAEG